MTGTKATDTTNTPETPPSDPDDQAGQDPAGNGDEGGNGGDNPSTGTEDRTPDQIISDLSALGERIVSTLQKGAASLTTAQLDSIAVVARSVDNALTEAGFEGSVASQAARAYEVRDQAIGEALGSDLTVENIRSLRRSAEMGNELFNELVQDAVAARVGALQDLANADEYRKQLEASRSVSFVKSEIRAYSAIKERKFTSGRTVIPPALPEPKGSKTAPAKPDASGGNNILSPR